MKVMNCSLHNTMSFQNISIFLYCLISTYFTQYCFICRTSDSTVLTMLGSHPELLRLWYWQSDALTALGYISSTDLPVFEHGDFPINIKMTKISSQVCSLYC